MTSPVPVVHPASTIAFTELDEEFFRVGDAMADLTVEREDFADLGGCPPPIWRRVLDRLFLRRQAKPSLVVAS